jgi:predicted secreted protein
MACKMTSKGTKLYYDADGVDPYTQLTGVESLDGPDVTKEMEEQTDLDSSGGWKEYCTNFKDGGELTANIFTTKTIEAILYSTLFASDTAYYWKVTFPLQSGESTASTITFQGFLTRIGKSVPAKGNITTPITIKVTGAVTWTSGS